MFDVFISYSRADSYIADEIYKGLIGKGLNVFYDKESIRTESFPSKIAQGIKESKIVLFLQVLLLLHLIMLLMNWYMQKIISQEIPLLCIK